MTKLAQKAEHAIITSFGVFAGIGFNGDISDKYPSEEHVFLTALKDHPDLSMIIGIHNYYSPYPSYLAPGHCRHCLGAHAKRVMRIETHRELFPNIKWYLLHKLHSKVATFWTGDKAISIIGSRNFTNSQSMEAAMVIQGPVEANAIKDYAISLKDAAEPVEIDKLMNFLVDDTGSDYCLKMICGES